MEREESEDDGAVDRGAVGASKRARAVVNDRRRLHLNNGFVDLNQKFPHGLFPDEDYKKFFEDAKAAGNAVGCTRCLWSLQPGAISATDGKKMHLLCNGPFNKRGQLNVETKKCWVLAVGPEMWKQLEEAMVRKWEHDDAYAEGDDEYFQLEARDAIKDDGDLME